MSIELAEVCAHRPETAVLVGLRVGGEDFSQDGNTISKLLLDLNRGRETGNAYRSRSSISPGRSSETQQLVPAPMTTTFFWGWIPLTGMKAGYR
jgi:hypothetical protein